MFQSISMIRTNIMLQYCVCRKKYKEYTWCVYTNVYGVKYINKLIVTHWYTLYTYCMYISLLHFEQTLNSKNNETFTSNHSTLHEISYRTMCYSIFHPSAEWLSVATASPANIANCFTKICWHKLKQSESAAKTQNASASSNKHESNGSKLIGRETIVLKMFKMSWREPLQYLLNQN